MVVVANIFVSYRTDDSVHAVMAISDRLMRHFGSSSVFRDQDSIALGARYPDRIRGALRRSDVVLAVIGRHWLNAEAEGGRRRIDDDRDWVRWELRTAFRQRIPVIPVLLDDARLPERTELPGDLGELSVSAGWWVRHRTLESDIAALIGRLDVLFPGSARSAESGPSAGGTYQQHNVATNDSAVYANQGGTQVINVNDHKGSRS